MFQKLRLDDEERGALEAVAIDLAHWPDSDIQVGGKGMSLTEVLVAYPASAAQALRRMRSTATHYLDEMRELIDEHHYTEILHHAGHVWFEMTAAERLVRAQLSVLRGEHLAKTETAPGPPAPPGGSLGPPWGEHELAMLHRRNMRAKQTPQVTLVREAMASARLDGETVPMPQGAPLKCEYHPIYRECVRCGGAMNRGDDLECPVAREVGNGS